jgi:mannose-6-phosphate isomerase
MHNDEYVSGKRVDPQIHPFKLSPVYLEKIWGGQAFKTILGKEIPPTSKIGESWEISVEEPYQTTILQGEFNSHKLGDFCKMFGPQLLGKTDDSNKFPLLFKFIDANDKLSIQVHPDDTQAIEHKWGLRGKTECWYIVDAPKDGTIIVGLNKSISKDEMFDAIEKGTFKNLLKEEKVYPDDLLLIPAGTIHSIMSKTLIYEAGTVYLLPWRTAF